MSGITGSMVLDDMKLSAIKAGIGLLIIAVLLFSAWLFFRYKFRKQVKPLGSWESIDREPKEISASSMMRSVVVTSENSHDARSYEIPQYPHLFVVPVTQAMLDSGVYANEGSSGWLMQHAGLVGQPLVVTAEELQSDRVILRDVLPGGDRQPKVSVLHLPLLKPLVMPAGRTPESLYKLVRNNLNRDFLMLFEATAAAELEPGTSVVLPMINYEGVSLSPQAYQQAFVEAFFEAAGSLTGNCRRTLVSYLRVRYLSIHIPGNMPERCCMANHFRCLGRRVEEVLEQQPGLGILSAIESVSEAAAAEAAAVAANPELDPTGALSSAGLDGAGLDGARRSP